MRSFQEPSTDPFKSCLQTALDAAMYLDNPEGYDSGSYLSELQPGATGTVTLGYVLKDDSEITVDVTNLLDFSDTAKVTYKFAI